MTATTATMYSTKLSCNFRRRCTKNIVHEVPLYYLVSFYQKNTQILRWFGINYSRSFYLHIIFKEKKSYLLLIFLQKISVLSAKYRQKKTKVTIIFVQNIFTCVFLALNYICSKKIIQQKTYQYVCPLKNVLITYFVSLSYVVIFWCFFTEI